ncbi:hypothetical protein JQ632_19695 [Bradyrhizobium liaoningense]|nr:hypothetical protein [Bradyrhizobium liaoningense]
MKFMLVNQGRPGEGSACSACAEPLGSNYLRHVPTRRPYCDYDCYRQYRLTAMAMPWSDPGSLEAITVFAAIASWSWMMQIGALSHALTEAFLRAHDLLLLPEGRDG